MNIPVELNLTIWFVVVYSVIYLLLRTDIKLKSSIQTDEEHLVEFFRGI